MMSKTLLSVFSELAVFVIVLSILAQCTSTPGIDAKDNKHGNSIAEFRTITIGEIKQTILIRGNNTSNPILLYLHGGPGSTEMVPFRIFHSELEKHFTVVIWEQRGTGKSYYSGINEESMTIAQFIFDTHELTTYLLNTFHKDKILIVGHSWGSALGLLFVQKYPDLVHAYVGSGQMVNPAQAERISYNFIKNKTIDNEDAQKELMTIDQPFPYLTIAGDEDWFSKLKIHRKWLVKMGGEFYGKNDYSTFMNRKILIAPEYSIFDYIRFGLGSNFSLKVMWPQVMKLDFFSKIPEVSLPVFLLQGRNDYNTPSILVKDYFLKLKAPRKELIWFEESGHHPMYEEPEKFDRILIEKLLPICREDL